MIIFLKILLGVILSIVSFYCFKLAYDEHKVYMRKMTLEADWYEWVLTTEGYYDEEV